MSKEQMVGFLPLFQVRKATGCRSGFVWLVEVVTGLRRDHG